MILALVLLATLVGDARADDLHVLRAGEGIADVATLFGLTEAELRAANQLGPAVTPPPGTVLRVPGKDVVPSQAVVLSLAGTGTVRLPSGDSQPLRVALALPVGSTVCTDETSYTTLRLAAGDSHDHDELTLLGGTCLTVDSASARGGLRSTVVSVDRGGVSVRDAGDTPGTVSVLSGDAVTSGEGGGFRVTREPEGSARTEALAHPVAVIGAGQQLDLGAGYGSRVEPGQAPSAPVALLAAPALQAPADDAALRRPDFGWADVRSALAFRVELSSTEDFSALLYMDRAGALTWAPDVLFLPLLPTGWWWRISSIDRTGFVGPPSEARHVRPPVDP